VSVRGNDLGLGNTAYIEYETPSRSNLNPTNFRYDTAHAYVYRSSHADITHGSLHSTFKLSSASGNLGPVTLQGSSVTWDELSLVVWSPSHTKPLISSNSFLNLRVRNRVDCASWADTPPM
jgi:hypothetical protein